MSTLSYCVYSYIYTVTKVVTSYVRITYIFHYDNNTDLWNSGHSSI